LNILVHASEARISEATRKVVMAGGGPVGIRLAQELARRGLQVVIINAERWRPYNRVKLTPLLAGEAQVGQIYLDPHFPGPGKVQRYDGVSVVDIAREPRLVLTSTGRAIPYSKLVLALGSHAFVPAIPGANLPGVYTFRNFSDAEALLARSMSARRVAVIGGGLLGLEAARGMRQRGASVTVIEHENRLLPRQLDEAAGTVLQARVEGLGLGILTGERVLSIDGEFRVSGVTLGSGRHLTVDTVIICTGVRANTQLAAATGLKFNRGIMVDDEMRTSDPHIYAAGECAEHNGIVYGLVGPGFEQALAVAASIAGETVCYQGSTPATKLKVLGADVFSIGDFESFAQVPGVKSAVHRLADGFRYRRIIVGHGRLLAAFGVGEWPEATRLQEAIARRRRIHFWNLWRFRRSGLLWNQDNAAIAAWPREAIVCNCTGVTRGALADAITLGAASFNDVRAATGASTVCGTCRPLILDLMGAGAMTLDPARWWKWLAGLSIAAAIAALVTLLAPRIPLRDTFISGDLAYRLWFDTVWKQWSGISLLAVTIAAAALGLRRRIALLSRLGSHDAWRLIHISIGLVAVPFLAWHTGFRLGSNLNLVLVSSFITALLLGAVTGAVAGGEHELRDRQLVATRRSPRVLPFWLHLLALWPLPVLIAVHVFVVYSY